MSDLDKLVSNILGRILLVEEIEKIAEEKKSDYQLQGNACLKEFINALTPLISNDGNDWDKNDDFLKLSYAINNQITLKLNERREVKMIRLDEAVAVTTATQSIGISDIVSGVILLIGIAIGGYYISKSKPIDSDESTLDKIKGKAKGVKDEIAAGLQNSNNTPHQEQAIQVFHSPPKPTPSYGQYDLLLIIPANQLDDKLTQGSVISKNDTEKLIANAMRAYCFAQSDPEGQKVLNSVDYSEEPINFKIESRVFLQLSLLAKSGIKKHDKLSIRESIQSDQQVKIKILKKMGSLHSIRDFYGI